MLWLLATLITLALLAWRGTQLAHATGVLGLLLLAYGWLGESSAVFFLGFSVFLLVMLPLNAKSLRQEWLSRALLESLLTQRPALATSRSSSAVASLSGEAIRLPPRAGGVPTGAAEAAAVALLRARLAQPLLASPATPAAAELAADLLTQAALNAYCLHRLPCVPDAALDVAFAPHFNQEAVHKASPCRGETQPAWLAEVDFWSMAAAAQRLGQPLSAFSATTSPEDDAAQLADFLAANHRDWQALLRACHDDHPYTRLIAFDRALCDWLRSAVQHGLKALGLALSNGAWLPVAAADELSQPAHRAMALALSRQATIFNALLLCRLAESKPVNQALEQATSAAWRSLRALLHGQALLQWPEQAKAPHLEHPLWQLAVHRAQAQLAHAQWQAIQSLHARPLRWLLRGLCFPLGRPAGVPETVAPALAAQVLFAHPEVQERVLGQHESTELKNLLAHAAPLRDLQGALAQLARSHFPESCVDDLSRVAHAAQMGVLEATEAARLVSALHFAQTLRTP